MKISNSKIVVTPSAIHVTQFSKSYSYDFIRKPRKVKLNSLIKPKSKTSSNFFSLYRAKKQVRLIIECNAKKSFETRLFRPLFATLTFAENITDIKHANKEFGNFCKRLKRVAQTMKGCSDFILKYLVVPEFQKRGAIHYHVVFFYFPIIQDTNSFLQKIWGHGFTFNNTIKSTEHLKNYVTKYFTKDINDVRLNGKKHYFCSRNILRPTVYKDQANNEMIIAILQNPAYEKIFKNSEKIIKYSYYPENPLSPLLFTDKT